MKVDKDVLALIDRQMQAAGITEHRLEMGGKHPRLVYVQNGQTHSYTLPGTPSDHRAARNLVADLRRALGLSAVKAPPAEELPPPRVLTEAQAHIAAHPPSTPTAKDLRALDLLDRDFVSAVAVGRRQGAPDPARWAVEHLERLAVLGLAESDGHGRYRRA